jgi:hypothetical protein
MLNDAIDPSQSCVGSHLQSVGAAKAHSVVQSLQHLDTAVKLEWFINLNSLVNLICETGYDSSKFRVQFKRLRY